VLTLERPRSVKRLMPLWCRRLAKTGSTVATRHCCSRCLAAQTERQLCPTQWTAGWACRRSATGRGCVKTP
jgi:hypothetical protein